MALQLQAVDGLESFQVRSAFDRLINNYGMRFLWYPEWSDCRIPRPAIYPCRCALKNEVYLFLILGRNDFILRANRLSVRAKRVRANRTSGETTCFRARCRPTPLALTLLAAGQREDLWHPGYFFWSFVNTFHINFTKYFGRWRTDI